MNILAIRGKNLASLDGCFEIDFRQEPLRSTGLFAITGHTGAGKTTILDAMCIALYERSPRLDNIKHSCAIEVNGSRSLSESDPKTILRRGKYEGYAEVDFEAVDGNAYRVRWSISRTNNSATGNFRKTSYDLLNIRTGESEILSQASYKEKIPRLIGLTYEQFTRAVLLAQGNFAAFLKADENEKASILETLTGSDIYSRISALIYSKSANAKRELDAVEEKLHGIVLLTQEEIECITAKKDSLFTRQQENEKTHRSFLAKKEWIERSALLEKEYFQAVEAKHIAEENFAKLEETVSILRTIDTIQEIRDSYNIKRSVEEQREGNNKELLALEGKMAAQENVLSQLVVETADAVKHQHEVGEKFNSMQPRINEAAKLEENVAMGDSRLKELNNEIEKYNREKHLLAERREKSLKHTEQLEKESNDIELWFKENAGYSNIVPLVPAILLNIKVIENHLLHIAENGKSLEKATELLAHYEKRLQQLQQRSEELENTLPSEIAALRSRLTPGAPCPVCGSKEHYIIEEVKRVLEEKQLDIAKKEVKKETERTVADIDAVRAQANTLRGAIETHKATVANLEQKNIDLFGSKELAETILAGEKAAEKLETVAKEWNSRAERAKGIAEEKNIAGNALKATDERLAAINEELCAKELLKGKLQENIKEQREKIKELLGSGKSAAETQGEFNTLIAKASEKVSAIAEKKATSASLLQRIKGEIEAKKEHISRQENNYRLAEEKIAVFLQLHKDEISAESLSALISIEPGAVASMREKIDDAGKALTAAATTLLERRRNVDEHNSKEGRPSGSESIEYLEDAIANTKLTSKQLLEEIGNLNATLLSDKENNIKFGKLKEERDDKRKICSQWSLLNQTFGSAKGEKLMRLTQGYTLDILLKVANKHLHEISGRYMLERISEKSLGIKVIDTDMLSQTRSVHTLSGGETFIVSLALSLALSSISSSRMNIGSLFIDEGFGALDSETLRFAITALERLQNQGRKIGVISHLGEMLERIPVKVKVVRTGPGKSIIEITDK